MDTTETETIKPYTEGGPALIPCDPPIAGKRNSVRSSNYLDLARKHPGQWFKVNAVEGFSTSVSSQVRTGHVWGAKPGEFKTFTSNRREVPGYKGQRVDLMVCYIGEETEHETESTPSESEDSSILI